MTETSSANATRRAAILDAATSVFLRYGLKKTSMDDLARAAGLSRQGLYLHFATKEALFRESVLRILTSAAAASREALEREEQPVEERLLTAFTCVHAATHGAVPAEHQGELIEEAREMLGVQFAELDEEFVNDLARVIRSAGIAARWKGAGLSGKDLAVHLRDASMGIKHAVASADEYRERMKIAVKLVCRGSAE